MDTVALYAVPKDAVRRSDGRKRASRIMVELALNGDNSGDARVARQVLDVLAENKGDVPYSFWLKSPSGRVKLDFTATTGYSPQLEDRLADLIGRDCLHVDWA